MKVSIEIPLTVLLCCLFFGQSLFAQDNITSSVFGNGAAVSGDANNAIVGTIGQATIGMTAGSNRQLNSGFWYSTFEMVTSVEQIEDELVLAEFQLDQNYPNPFNPSTTIRFAVPKTSHVTIRIYDILGRQVATLVDDDYSAGAYKIVFEASELASGVYIYRIQADGYVKVRKLMLVK